MLRWLRGRDPGRLFLFMVPFDLKAMRHQKTGVEKSRFPSLGNYIQVSTGQEKDEEMSERIESEDVVILTRTCRMTLLLGLHIYSFTFAWDGPLNPTSAA